MEYKIAVIKGDGIGPEIVSEAIDVLECVGKKFGHTFHSRKCWQAAARLTHTDCR